MSDHPRCNAKTRSGGRCKLPAGWGTDHLGNRSCKLHRGCTEFDYGPANPAFKHGRYSKYHSPEKLAAFEAWKAASSTENDRLSAENEWGLFCLEDYLAQHGHELEPYDLARTLNEIADLRLKAQKLRGGEKASRHEVVMTLENWWEGMAAAEEQDAPPADTPATEETQP